MKPTPFTLCILGVVAAFIGLSFPLYASSPNIVISQVYGGGGNTGATYKNDFIELFNRGAAAVDVTGWTIQYLSLIHILTLPTNREV
mgnify:CR=1 FL=1